MDEARDAPLYDPALLDEPDVDIAADQRKLILDAFARLDTCNYYELLGVVRDADKKVIKRAYFEAAGHFHPDRFFRKRLGTFKQKMETVFGRITQAHDVLTVKEQRAEYDLYLAEQARARGLEAALGGAAKEVERAEEDILRSAGSAPPAERPAGPRASAPSITPSPVVSEQARRDALARRLLGGRASVPPQQQRSSLPPQGSHGAGGPGPQGAPHLSTADAMAALRRRYEERVNQSRLFQVNKYQQEAQAAQARNDPVSAANAYRIAATLMPEDSELKKRAEDAQQAADLALSESYSRQASYEEKSGHWEAAARSWQRVIKARGDDPHPLERAAHAFSKAGSNLHEAATLASRAIELAPTNVQLKITLANVYIAAGLTLNAKRELEAAARLAPDNGTIREMLSRIGKNV